ncbi:MAG: zinc metallopeptidase [Syntrophomonadaceae bacterium]|nr:zinc metallopeptidase [Syntrophomonadaceae bacterium]MDD3888336.1 zinc metallopeptidase [Syntrophomonadaceae bacterium]MDD4548843.1 zinc metallopeptidase [Syntrophomonadaceae bacterium]
MGYLIIILPALILSIYAQFKVKATFEKYSKVRSNRGITGADVASTILRRNGMGGKVGIESVKGKLSDHYDPMAKTVRLSETVYGQNSIAAIGVAAHETGHAIQHNQAYGPLELRHRIVPVANFASSASFPILLLGFFMQSMNLVMVGIILFSAVVVFHLVTLPVELNASRRAIVQLSEAGLVANDEIPMVKKVLGAAALTYLAAALTAVANLLYYLLIFMGGSDN